MDSGDDVQLVGRCLGGEVDAFEPLVARYQKVLFNVALRLLGDREDARDVTQSAFAKAYEKLHTYDPSYRFFSWIYRIALNESLNLKHRRPIMTPLDERLAARDTPFDQAFAHEMSERIQAAILKLPPEQREVVVLRHFGDLGYSDIAVGPRRTGEDGEVPALFRPTTACGDPAFTEDGAMIDEDLLHRAIDGEATLEETRRLEEALRLDATARERYEELRRLQGAIDSVPRVDPPAGLLQAVMSAVRLRARPGSRAPRPGTGCGRRSPAGRD